MSENPSKYLITTIGIFYLALSSLAFFNVFYYSSTKNLLWFCYIGLLLIGIGILTYNPVLIKSQIYLLAIPNLIWTIDFIVRATQGTSFLGMTDYFFLPAPILQKIVTLQHIFTVPLAIYILFKMPRKNYNYDALISIIQAGILYVLVILLTSSEDNVNCAYNFCGSLHITFAYPVLWFASVIIMVFITKKTIDSILYNCPSKALR